MLRSLRFQLPALFLLGIVVSGLIAAVVALRLFQGYVLSRSKADLRREAIGLTEVFAQQAITSNDTGVPLPRIVISLTSVALPLTPLLGSTNTTIPLPRSVAFSRIENRPRFGSDSVPCTVIKPWGDEVP